MPIKHITSRDNPEYKRLLALAEEARERRATNSTLVDGEHLLEESIRAGITPDCLVLQEGKLADHWLGRFPDLPTLILSDTLFRKLSPVTNPSGLLARIGVPSFQHAAGDAVLLLEEIQDPGNLGAIFRVAAAAGVTDILLSSGCAEAWSPKALRGGQGAQFRVRVREAVDLRAWLADWTGPAYAAVLGADRSLYDLKFDGPVAFVFGNEGRGLGATVRERCEAFSIPMAAEVESLNVAVSVAVCLYERFRQRLK
jgi:TrmH family RNA methyltransferase